MMYLETSMEINVINNAVQSLLSTININNGLVA